MKDEPITAATIDGAPCAWIERHPSGWRWWVARDGRVQAEGEVRGYNDAWTCGLAVARARLGAGVEEMPF